MYLAASTRSQVATAQHGDHGFPKCGILCPDIRDPIAVPFHHFKKYAIRQSFAVFLLLTPLFFLEFLCSNDKGNGGIWQAQMTKRIYRPLSPEGWATGPCRPLGGNRAFFSSRDLIANLKKKITLKACRPMGGRPGGIFEIFQNGHIFLKFLFLKNIKKKKPPASAKWGPGLYIWASDTPRRVCGGLGDRKLEGPLSGPRYPSPDSSS